mmetsp:Transcript_68611/g.143149  ORF Transcript_68611/g.143149 Transcript_68611/m.143149 type:complete len:149 (+) Transcript_68611:3-449(+)
MGIVSPAVSLVCFFACFVAACCSLAQATTHADGCALAADPSWRRACALQPGALRTTGVSHDIMGAAAAAEEDRTLSLDLGIGYSCNRAMSLRGGWMRHVQIRKAEARRKKVWIQEAKAKAKELREERAKKNDQTKKDTKEAEPTKMDA